MRYGLGVWQDWKIVGASSSSPPSSSSPSASVVLPGNYHPPCLSGNTKVLSRMGQKSTGSKVLPKRNQKSTGSEVLAQMGRKSTGSKAGPSVFPPSRVLRIVGPSVFPDSQVEKSSFETQSGLSGTSFKSKTTSEYSRQLRSIPDPSSRFKNPLF